MIVRKLDVVAQGLSRLLEQYKDKPILFGLLKPFLVQFQKLQDAAWEVTTLRYLDTAKGVQLDVLGIILNVGRKNRSDSDYLIALKAEILILHCDGTPPQIGKILKLACPVTFSYAEFYPAGIKVRLLSVPSFDVDTLRTDILLRCKPAGVRLELIYPTSDTKAFRFRPYGASTPYLDPDHGFAHGTDGGLFPHVSLP